MDKNSGGVLPASRGMITVQILVDVIIWLTVALPTLYLFLQGTPYDRGFFCDDDNLSYPYRHDTITTPVLIAAGFTISFLTIILTEVLNCVARKCQRPSQPVGDIRHCVNSYAVFLVGFIIQEFAVEVVKNKMGVLRPNYLDVCKPSFNRTSCPGYITQYTCTGHEYGDRTVQSSRKSFPSGHAAFSMYIAAFFCIYVQNRLQINFSRLLKMFLQAGLVFLAILCGLSRIKDNKHHPSDVIAGFILGVTVAIFVCRTIGRKLLGSKNVKRLEQLPLHTIGKSRGCCYSGEQTPGSEPQTPTLLLPNEYFHRNTSESEISSIKLKPNENNNCRMLPSLSMKTVDNNLV